MRVCLVSPATATDFGESQIAKSKRVRGIVEHPPVGILVLAAILEQRGIEVFVVDLNRTYLEYLKTTRCSAGGADFAEAAAMKLSRLPADVFGFRTLCSSYAVTIRIAARLRLLKTDVPVILGGPHASVVDVGTLETFPFFDYIVRGEAEETLPQVLEALARGKQPAHVAGVTYREGGTIVRNPDASVIADLDAVPAPAYHLWPYLDGWDTLPLELGRGCPFGCTFCSTNLFFQRRYRVKSPEAMIRQMRFFRQTFGICRFNLIHDSFTADQEKVLAFCDALDRSGESFSWDVSARTDCLNDTMIQRMAGSGCHGVFLGIETGSPSLQKIIHKRLDLTDALRKIRRLDKCGIRSVVSLIIGFPEETRSSLEQTINFLIESIRSDKVEPQLHLLAPLPGTPIQLRYGGLLQLDGHFSDISSHGSARDPADLEMIRSSPFLFASYYHVPTPLLDRAYLVELREFVLAAIGLHWLFVALHQDAGGILHLFESWRAWRSARRSRRSADCSPGSDCYGRRFRRDFLRFLESEYIPGRGGNASLLDALVKCEVLGQGLRSRRPRSSPASGRLRFDDIPVPARGVTAFEVGVDLEILIGCLRRKAHMNRVPRTPVTIALRAFDGGVERLQLTPDSARLLRLCDGTRTVQGIVRAFAAGRKRTSGIPESKAAEFGLLCLQQQHLIVADRKRLRQLH